METGLLETALLRVSDDLGALEQEWALVGGLAFSVLADPRTTRDIDVAVVVDNDRQAESLIRDLAARGYRIELPLEQEYVDRLATVRLIPTRSDAVIVDLLFASSGIEPEIVALANVLEVFPGLSAPVIAPGHLIALKTLAGRGRDIEDARVLIRQATAQDMQLARESLVLISRRGFDRRKDLQAELGKVIASSDDPYRGSP